MANASGAEAPRRPAIAAVLADVTAEACLVKMTPGSLEAGATYLLDGHGLRFLAGKVVWVSGASAGLFFNPPLHDQTTQRIRALVESDGLKLRLVAEPRRPSRPTLAA